MCGCTKTTYLCQCRHKERRVERCHIYQLRDEGSCWAWCFPNCRTTVRKHRLKRVCRDCGDYFYEKYGEELYKKFIQLFLEYKESKGWGKIAIDPRTVPREVLLKRQSAPPQLASRSDGQPRARGQPFQVHQPMVLMQPPVRRQGERRSSPVAEEIDRPPIRRHGTPFVHQPAPPSPSEGSVVTAISSLKATFVPKVSGAKAQRSEPSYVPNLNKPLPADPSLFVVGDSEDEDDNNTGHVEKPRVFTPDPEPVYDSTRLPLDFGIVPELAHLARDRRRGKRRHNRHPPKLQHPQPKHYKIPRRLRNPESVSDCSLVKRLTKAARKLVIPNLDWDEIDGKLVPREMTPLPGEPRTPTPPSSPATPKLLTTTGLYSPIDMAIANNAMLGLLVPGRRPKMSEPYSTRHNGALTTSPKSYFVTTEEDPNSPTGASVRVRRSRSHESVVVPPPQRLDGVLVPSASECPRHPNKGKGDPYADCIACRGLFFRERGLPSEAFVQQECRSATFEKRHSPVLVSVNLPERRYSCAVQACHCGDLKDTGKCTPCRQRDSISKQLQSDWI
ncbi:hypothetical protein RRF57_012722 [Xylaria bambusicola]|uniref:Uncharacterized protein n=1 Tax=Xylaria bambusicola TaxID=326684 RepID=A0AAN7Z4R6_9PEZI